MYENELNEVAILILTFLCPASIEPNSTPGNTTFIAGFTQCTHPCPIIVYFCTFIKHSTANVGDTSPNTFVYSVVLCSNNC